MGLKQVAISVDQLVNTLIGGYADETISSRAWRLGDESRVWGFARKAIDALFGVDHCKDSYQSEIERRQSPVEVRRG